MCILHDLVLFGGGTFVVCTREGYTHTYTHKPSQRLLTATQTQLQIFPLSTHGAQATTDNQAVKYNQNRQQVVPNNHENPPRHTTSDALPLDRRFIY